MSDARQTRWKALADLLDDAARKGARALTATQLKLVCRLYRQVSIDLSRARAERESDDTLFYLNMLASRAHGFVYGSKKGNLREALEFLPFGFPRLVRRSAGPIFASAVILAATTLASFFAVVRQPALAYSLFDEGAIEFENLRLKKQKGEYRGNFEYISKESSPSAAAQIITNNVRVALMALGLGALFCLPGCLLMAYTGRMVGAISGVTYNYGHAGDFYSLILTHGVLELSAIVIAGGAGLMLGWSLISPGQWARTGALKRAATDAVGLFLGAAVMLVLAGLIEAFITPHFGKPVRLSTAAVTAIGLFLYLRYAGVSRPAAGGDQIRPPSTIST